LYMGFFLLLVLSYDGVLVFGLLFLYGDIL
jgi:hypothetical protein